MVTLPFTVARADGNMVDHPATLRNEQGGAFHVGDRGQEHD